MSVTIYHNPRCSKSRQTLQLLQQKDVDADVVEYLKTPPSKAELKRILKMLGKNAKDIVRRKEAAEAGVDADALGEAALIEAIVANPQILERPIVVAGDKAALGRPPENVLDIL